MRRILMALLMSTTAVSAQDMTRSAGFDAALTAWLADDDATAIPAFAELAQAGEYPAQLLLGVIEHLGQVQTDWSLGLDREARIATYRQPGGLSGRGWLLDLDTELAALLRDLDDVNTSVETLRALDARGERRLAAEGVRLMSRREQYADVRAAVDALPHLAHVAAPLVPGIVAEAPAVHPLVTAWCAQTCPEVASCADTAAGAVEDWALGSPLVALIPEDRWGDSAKGLASVTRWAEVRGVEISQACEVDE